MTTLHPIETEGYEPEPWEIAWAESAKQVEIAAAEWRSRWPHHCKHCHGWGGSWYEESHGFKGGGFETIFEPCDALTHPTTCHRCGFAGLDADGNGPCALCGWNCDDGEPTL